MTSTETPSPPAAPADGDKSALTVTEASEKYDIPKRALHQAIRRGQVPARKIGPLHIVDAEAARLYGAVFAARRALDAYNGTDTDDSE